MAKVDLFQQSLVFIEIGSSLRGRQTPISSPTQYTTLYQKPTSEITKSSAAKISNELFLG